MKWLKLLIFKWLQHELYQLEPLEVEVMNKWLRFSYKDRGFKNYYTMRKKYLVSALSLGIEGKEMYRLLGRLEELKSLSANINTAAKQVKDEKTISQKKKE